MPATGERIYGETSSNTYFARITAKIWDLRIEAHPIDGAPTTVDYIRYAIRDEVAEADPTKCLENEAACLLGTLDATSPTRLTTIADVRAMPRAQSCRFLLSRKALGHGQTLLRSAGMCTCPHGP